MFLVRYLLPSHLKYINITLEVYYNTWLPTIDAASGTSFLHCNNSLKTDKNLIRTLNYLDFLSCKVVAKVSSLVDNPVCICYKTKKHGIGC